MTAGVVSQTGDGGVTQTVLSSSLSTVASTAASQTTSLSTAVGSGGGGGGMITQVGALKSANFNSTADQAIALTGPAGNWIIDSIIIANPSGSITTAKGGFYTAASKTGQLLSNGGTTFPYAAITGATVAGGVMLLNATLASNLAGVTQYFTSASQTIFLSLTTPQGSALTADIYVFGRQLT